MEMQRAPAYPEDRAMLICVALAPTPVDRWRARIAGQEVSVSHSIAFATTVIDLMKPMEMWAAGPFDYLHYYVSACCWTELQQTTGLRRLIRFGWSSLKGISSLPN